MVVRDLEFLRDWLGASTVCDRAQHRHCCEVRGRDGPHYMRSLCPAPMRPSW